MEHERCRAFDRENVPCCADPGGRPGPIQARGPDLAADAHLAAVRVDGRNRHALAPDQGGGAGPQLDGSVPVAARAARPTGVSGCPRAPGRPTPNRRPAPAATPAPGAAGEPPSAATSAAG